MPDTNTKPLTVATYTSGPRAHLAKSILERNGIQTAVVGDQIADTLGYIGVVVTKVELLVRHSDAEEARRLLSEWERNGSSGMQDRWGSETRMGWLCSDCSEINVSNFDECWSCSATRPHNAELVPLPDYVEASPDPPDLITAPENTDPSPYRVPHIENLPNRPAANVQLIDRTFRSAVLGIGIPPLAPYSFGLACRCVGAGRPTSKVWAAMCISAVTMLLWLAIFVS
jgi:hypothetical protein